MRESTREEVEYLYSQHFSRLSLRSGFGQCRGSSVETEERAPVLCVAFAERQVPPKSTEAGVVSCLLQYQRLGGLYDALYTIQHHETRQRQKDRRKGWQLGRKFVQA